MCSVCCEWFHFQSQFMFSMLKLHASISGESVYGFLCHDMAQISIKVEANLRYVSKFRITGSNSYKVCLKIVLKSIQTSSNNNKQTKWWMLLSSSLLTAATTKNMNDEGFLFLVVPHCLLVLWLPEFQLMNENANPITMSSNFLNMSSSYSVL